MRWLNLGGGHHITREGYDIDGLVKLVQYFREKYHTKVYLEPGEAIAMNTGILVGEVLDVVRNELDIAILDVSATCHMPDILEMPYRPGIKDGFDPGREGPYLSPGRPLLPGGRRHRRLVLRPTAE